MGLEIHELNTFEGTPGANDYLATDNGNETKKISAEQLLAAVNAALQQMGVDLNGRIDNIIAGGTAPSEAEIIDARRGENGIDYASLGAAIRGQYSDLKSDITNAFSAINIVDGILDARFVQNGSVYDIEAVNYEKLIYFPVEAGKRYTVYKGYSMGGVRIAFTQTTPVIGASADNYQALGSSSVIYATFTSPSSGYCVCRITWTGDSAPVDTVLSACYCYEGEYSASVNKDLVELNNVTDKQAIAEASEKISRVENAVISSDITYSTAEDITASTVFIDGYMNKNGETGSSSSYKYTHQINVKKGDVLSSGNVQYPLRYVTAFNDSSVLSAKGAESVSAYVVPDGVNKIVITIYSAVGTSSNAILKKESVTAYENNLHDVVEDVKNNTVYYKKETVDITESLTLTNGYCLTTGEQIASATYKYSNKIAVSAGTIIKTTGNSYPFRYVTAYIGEVPVNTLGAESVFSYTVPDLVDSVVVTIYAASTERILRTDTIPYNLFYNTLSQKNVGSFEKAYICLSCDDGADELATYTIPMIIAKDVPCTFGLYRTSPVFQHGYTSTVLDAVNNHNCEIAQHGGQHSWTDFTPEQLVSFFDDEEVFWNSIGVEVHSAIYPTHLSNPMVRAITGARFGCCRSGYNYDGILYYTDETRPSSALPYYGTGARSNLYAMASWNMPAGQDIPFAKECIDWAIANNKLIHFYWHDWDLSTASKTTLEAVIDYAKTKNITFVKLSDIPKLT